MTDLNIQKTSTHISNVDTSSPTKKPEEPSNNISIFGYEIDEDTLATVLNGAVDAIIGTSSFTKDEAAIFVNGEQEIKELLKNAPNNQNVVESIFDPNKTEREIREKYATEHPEYAQVMEEGLIIRKSYHDRERTI